jgi:hypothetical protein
MLFDPSILCNCAMKRRGVEHPMVRWVRVEWGRNKAIVAEGLVQSRQHRQRFCEHVGSILQLSPSVHREALNCGEFRQDRKIV